MKLLLDTDILLDVALDREDFPQSSAIFEWCQATPHSALVAWHTVSNLYYLLRAGRNDRVARNFISDLLRFVEVASGGTNAVHRALGLPMSDFEDALQVAAAISGQAQFIITRNAGDYRGSPIEALAPDNFLKRFVSR